MADGVEEARKAIVLTVVIIYTVVSCLFILAYLLVHYRSMIKRAFRRFAQSVEEYAHFVNMRWRYSRAIDLEKYVETINYHDLKEKRLSSYKYGHVIVSRGSFEKMDSENVDCTRGIVNQFSVAELLKPSPNELGIEDETCCICLELLKTHELDTLTAQDGVKVRSKGPPVPNSIRDTDIVMIPCQHYFHAGCLKEWFSSKKRGKRRPLVCPLCRMDLVKCKSICVKLGLLMSDLTVTTNSELQLPGPGSS